MFEGCLPTESVNKHDPSLTLSIYTAHRVYIGGNQVRGLLVNDTAGSKLTVTVH